MKTPYSKHRVLKNFVLFTLLCVICDVLLLKFWSLGIDVCTCCLIEDNSIKTLFMN